MLKMKKGLVLGLALAMCLSVGASASEISSNTDSEMNYNLSYNVPGETMTRTQEIPTSIFNVAQSGTYNFNGFTQYHNLYTNYLITGRTSYNIYVTSNYSDVKVTVYKDGFPFDTKLFTFMVNDSDIVQKKLTGIKSTDKIYIEFDPQTPNSPSSFSGYIF